MPRPAIGDRPMTATERQRRRREAIATELQRLRDENERLRAMLENYLSVGSLNPDRGPALERLVGSVDQPGRSDNLNLSATFDPPVANNRDRRRRIATPSIRRDNVAVNVDTDHAFSATMLGKLE